MVSTKQGFLPFSCFLSSLRLLMLNIEGKFFSPYALLRLLDYKAFNSQPL